MALRTIVEWVYIKILLHFSCNILLLWLILFIYSKTFACYFWRHRQELIFNFYTSSEKVTHMMSCHEFVNGEIHPKILSFNPKKYWVSNLRNSLKFKILFCCCANVNGRIQWEEKFRQAFFKRLCNIEQSRRGEKKLSDYLRITTPKENYFFKN